MQIFIAEGRVCRINNQEVTQTKNGKSKFQFDFACDSSFKKPNDEGTYSTFNHVVTYGKQAEMLNDSLTVGSPILIKGELIDSPYVNSDGEKRIFRFILPDKMNGVTFLESKDAGLLRKKNNAKNADYIVDEVEEYNSFPNELEEDNFPF